MGDSLDCTQYISSRVFNGSFQKVLVKVEQFSLRLELRYNQSSMG